MSHLRIEHDGAVRTITLARPEKRNAIDPQMMRELLEAFTVSPPEAERITVLRGDGPVFCAGLQLSTSGVDQSEAIAIENMFEAVQNYPLPVLAVVQGAAIAGGCELSLHCDFIVAADDAPFAMPLAQLGVATTWFLTKKLIEMAGPATTREFLLLGEPMPAARLHELGIVTRAVPRAELDAAAQVLIDRVAANAPMSLRTMKKLIVRQMDYLFDADHRHLDAEVAQVYASADAVEGVAARVEKRKATFKGA